MKPLLSSLLLLLQFQVFAQSTAELKPWLPKLEAEYQGVYHFGESENEMDFILICTTTKWYAQVVLGSFNADGTKWIKHFENLKEVKITGNSFYCSTTNGKFVINTTSTENSKALQIQQLWNSDATQQIGNKTQSLQSYFQGNFTKASTQFLTKDELNAYSKQDLKLIRNEIYARYGYKFKSGGEMDTYFKKQDWYNPQHENVDAFLTKIEKANSELILKAEQSK